MNGDPGDWFNSHFAIAFPIFFAGLWLLVTTALGMMSGWYGLMRRYPNVREEPLLKLRGQSGRIGMVQVNGILTLSACPSGLRVAMWPIFSPFGRPFFVPWDEIRTSRGAPAFWPTARLAFGSSFGTHLRLPLITWQRLALAAGRPTGPLVTNAALARGLVVIWLAMTALAGCFFYFGPRLLGAEPGLPAVLAFGFPTVMLAIGNALHYFRHRWPSEPR